MHNFDKHFEDTQRIIRRSQFYVLGAMIVFGLFWMTIVASVLGFICWLVITLLRYNQVI